MTEQELIDEFDKKCMSSASYAFKDIDEAYDYVRDYVEIFGTFKWGYNLAQETIAELESRLEQSVDIGVVSELNETIEKQKNEIKILLSLNVESDRKIKSKEIENLKQQLNTAEGTINHLKELII